MKHSLSDLFHRLDELNTYYPCYIPEKIEYGFSICFKNEGHDRFPVMRVGYKFPFEQMYVTFDDIRNNDYQMIREFVNLDINFAVLKVVNLASSHNLAEPLEEIVFCRVKDFDKLTSASAEVIDIVILQEKEHKV